MKDVGEFDKRNREFDEKFSRDKIIKNSVVMDDPTIFDIGGHEGESIDYLIRLFPNSKIYSFEPDPDSFKILQKKKSGNVHTFNLAISDKVGSAKFYRNKISHTNSLYKINTKSIDSIRVAEDCNNIKATCSDEISSEIKVKTTTLSKFVNENKINHIDLLKIDVQGSEKNVLSGGEEILKTVGSIIIEILFYDYYEQSNSFIDIEKILIPFGFKLFSILDISRNPMNGRTDWVEALYKRVE